MTEQKRTEHKRSCIYCGKEVVVVRTDDHAYPPDQRFAHDQCLKDARLASRQAGNTRHA